jgi:hypothetical protein
MNKISELKTILNAATAKGAGSEMYVGNAEEVIFLISTDGGGTAAFTLKPQVSLGDFANNTASDYEAAQAADNMWSYCKYTDISDNTTSSEVSASGADVYKIIKLEIPKGVSYVNARLTGYTAGEITVKAQAYYRE